MSVGSEISLFARAKASSVPLNNQELVHQYRLGLNIALAIDQDGNSGRRLFWYVGSQLKGKDSEVEICKANSSFEFATEEEEEEEEKVEVTIALKKNKYTIYSSAESENYQYLEGMSLEEIFELSPKDISYLYYYDGEAKKWQLYWPKYARYSKNTADIKITANHSDNKLALMGKKNGVVKFEVVR